MPASSMASWGRGYRTSVHILPVEGHGVVAVQYGPVLGHDPPFPAEHARATGTTRDGDQKCKTVPTTSRRMICKKVGSAPVLPVEPGAQHAAHEHQQEGRVRDPHDDHHGVHAQDGPGGGRHGGLRRGPAGGAAVLAGAGPRAVLQGVAARPRLVVHGGEARRRPVCSPPAPRPGEREREREREKREKRGERREKRGERRERSGRTVLDLHLHLADAFDTK